MPLKLGQEKELTSPDLNCSVNSSRWALKMGPRGPQGSFRGCARRNLFSYLFSTVSIFALMVPIKWWIRLLVPEQEPE